MLYATLRKESQVGEKNLTYKKDARKHFMRAFSTYYLKYVISRAFLVNDWVKKNRF